MLQAKTREQLMHIYRIYHDGNYGTPDKDGINLDGYITYDRMAEIVDYLRKEELPKWKRFSGNSCWSGEIGVRPTARLFTYEHYAINADKLFKLLDKEDKV